MEDRIRLTEQILELELAMFLSVPTAQKYRCQEDPEGFKLHRRAQFAAWSPATLESYLDDLQQAKATGRNLLALKYARMDNLVPCENFSVLIDAITDLAVQGQEQFIADYPGLMRGGRPLRQTENAPDLTSFETYLRGELESYSEKTLKRLNQDMLDLQKAGSNLSETIYRFLAKQWGFDSLENLEKTLREKGSP
ncbi:hypothetical protein A7E78_06340 [Syntrophotalea acetylenivorans]|uniref:DUF4125 domain-containing protein n=1 Tax=Syntrophotalea acetylenivorans TaxID=1842532 RepID=A0A1L3GNH5_9BACT|nr:DUF4125 family protein [Syntrophotalea acetylenivorans]APG27493.1 hypothetical protein A7E78_06340 [Syntrophotalea acetylenivorans]